MENKKLMTIKEIRKGYLEFFEKKKHLVLPSSSLIPGNDPTLLFTTAGMVPFKEYFSGERVPPSERIATVQKCLRTTDLEQVGHTKRHLSFFEMLGNFSFADYFKKEAIEFAWEFVSNYLPFDSKDVHISVFQDDDEAYDIWHKHIGIPASNIKRLGRADNFWGPAGDTGACGPSSELYLDRGEEFGPNLGGPGSEGERFMEFWNLVFNQFNFNGREYLSLANTGIDTGAGLERLATLVQKVDSVFDTDELKSLRDRVAELFQVPYEGEQKTAIRVITDHIRTLTFAISDGVLPSNEGRGYVLRRVLRRALLFARKLGQSEPLVYQLIDKVVFIYGEFYQELKTHQSLAEEYVKQEELRFLRTLAGGEDKLHDLFDKAADGAFKDGVIPGKDVFLLYDTYGFPPEMTRELAEEKGYSVDMQAFAEAMEEQRQRGRSAWKGNASQLPAVDAPATEFTGYDELTGNSEVLFLGNAGGRLNSLAEGEEGFLVTKSTPFYAESGGQLGDQGIIENSSFHAEVIDTRKHKEHHIHIIEVKRGTVRVGDTVEMHVDVARRESLAGNHSATHLLNAGLRSMFGNHIRQRGSLVSPDYLRFDFTHPTPLSPAEILAVESSVNSGIAASVAVETAVLAKDDAEKMGAVMTFGEKYGDIVRVVQMGDFSTEFCGGTHVINTSDIRAFVIAREGSPGAGNRRIEAVTGEKVRSLAVEKIAVLMGRISGLSQGIQEMEESRRSILGRVQSLVERAETLPLHEIAPLFSEIRELDPETSNFEKEWKKAEKKKSGAGTAVDETVIDQILAQSGNVVEYIGEGATIDSLKSLSDSLRSREPRRVYLLGGLADGKWNAVFSTGKQYAEENSIDLGSLIRAALSAAGIDGGGGGKKELSQGSGLGDSEILNSLFSAAKEQFIHT